MAIEIQPLHPPATEADIAELERFVGATLPDGYRRFLLEHNGGKPNPDAIEIEGLRGSPTDVHELLGVGRAPDGSNSLWYLREIPGRIPRGSVPIAIDSSGNTYCLVTEVPSRGRVIFVDEEPTYHNVGREGTVYHVADPFDEFLARLYDL